MRSLPDPVRCSCCSAIIMEGKPPRAGFVVLCRKCIDRLTAKLNHCDVCFADIDQSREIAHFVVGYGMLCECCYLETAHTPADDDEST